MTSNRAGVRSAWVPPQRVELDGNDLVWVHETQGGMRVEPRRGLLEGFIALSDSSGDAILGFARRWGVLCLCSHGLPITHNPGDLSSPPFSALARGAAALTQGCRPVRSRLARPDGRSLATSREPLETWRDFAELARLTLDAALCLADSQPVNATLWHSLLGMSSGAAGDRDLLTFVVRAWLRTTDVRVGFEWDETPQPTFVAGSLLGAIALELAFSTSGEAAVRCASCGTPFFPARRPPKGRRSYCPTCRQEGAPARDAAREYWHRKGKYRRKRSSAPQP
jgi:hypothetical protein